MDIEEIIAKAAAAATAAKEKEAGKVKRKVEAQATSADSPAAKRDAAAEKSRLLLEAARAREAKQGLDLVEELLRDISPNVLRAITREDATRLLGNGIRLTINFSKTDASSTIPSFTIHRSGSAKSERTIHRASIESWAASEAMFLDRYRRDGGNPNISSHHELMLELIRVNKENARLRAMLVHAGNKLADESRVPALPTLIIPTTIVAPVDAPMTPGSTETSQPVSVEQPVAGENIPAAPPASS